MTDHEWKMYTFQVMQLMAASNLTPEEFNAEIKKLRKAFGLDEIL